MRTERPQTDYMFARCLLRILYMCVSHALFVIRLALEHVNMVQRGSKILSRPLCLIVLQLTLTSKTEAPSHVLPGQFGGCSPWDYAWFIISSIKNWNSSFSLPRKEKDEFQLICLEDCPLNSKSLGGPWCLFLHTRSNNVSMHRKHNYSRHMSSTRTLRKLYWYSGLQSQVHQPQWPDLFQSRSMCAWEVRRVSVSASEEAGVIKWTF